MSDPLIDIGKLSEPITKLVEAVRSSVGVLYEPTHIRRIAQAQADAGLIKAEGDAKADEFRARIEARVSTTEVRRQRNIESIVGQAAKALPAAVSNEPVDPDWLVEFFNQSQDVGNETMQSLWARILAGETAEPDSFSLRTLHAVRLFQKYDAELFATACGYAVLLGPPDPAPMIFNATEEYFREHGLSPLERSHLSTLGLIRSDLSLSIKGGERLRFIYGSEHYEIGLIQANPPRAKLLAPSVFLLSFTQVGQELFPLANASPQAGYMEVLQTAFTRAGFELVRVPRD